MDIALLIPPADHSAAQPSSNASAETCQIQQHTQCGAFSALLKDAIKNTDDQQAPSLSDADNPGEPTPVTTAVDQATGPALTGIVVVSLSQAPDNQAVASVVAERTESLPIADANATVDQNSSPSQNPNGPTVQTIALIPPPLLNLTVAEPSDDRTPGLEPVANNPSQAKTPDTSNALPPQPAFNPDSSKEVPATQSVSPTTDEPASRNGRGVPAYFPPVPLDQPSDASAPSGIRPPSFPIPDQGPTLIMENQGGTNLLSTAQGQGKALGQSLARPSADIGPSAIIQEQGGQETTVPGPSLTIRMVGGGGGQDPFGASAQGDGESAGFHPSGSGTPEPAMRGTQATLFSDQFTSARQTQFLPQGAIAPNVTPAADQLKLAQAFLGEDHSATMTAARGMAQTVQVVLPSHEAGPLSVRISMVDQTVHTQFTTDRSDLGAILMGRQDQLQQNLTKSGLELGQFQVHINQEGRQDTFPDRQSRRNGEASEQQPASQDQNRQPQDRERPNHRPTRALSLFA